MGFCNLARMNSLLAVAVQCMLLAGNHATSYPSKTPKLEFLNKASSSSQSEEKKNYASCLMHFVDADLHPNFYLANGGLISNNKVLTTRDFLEKYESDITKRNLTVFSSIWKTKDPLSKVNGVHIDDVCDSELAVASLEKYLSYNEFITNCVMTYKHDKYIPKQQITVSGWRFQNRNAAFKGTKKSVQKNLIATLNRREKNAHGLKQESYHRLSFVNAASGDEYKDRHCEMNVGDEGALVSVIRMTAGEEQILLLAIASVNKQVYITLSSSRDFIREKYLNQPDSDS